MNINFIKSTSLYFRVLNFYFFKSVKNWIIILFIVIGTPLLVSFSINSIFNSSEILKSFDLKKVFFLGSVSFLLISINIINLFILTPMVINVKKITFIQKNLISNKFRIKNITPMFIFFPFLILLFFLEILIIYFVTEPEIKKQIIFDDINWAYFVFYIVITLIFYSLLSSIMYNWISNHRTLNIVLILILLIPIILWIIGAFLPTLKDNEQGMDFKKIFNNFIFYINPWSSFFELQYYIYIKNDWSTEKIGMKVLKIIMPIFWLITLIFLTFIKNIGKKDTKPFFKNLFNKKK